ncbi:hypothetical protein LLG95_13125 [bacterium]|nr:hypothetical protein [bacterium]
MALPAGAKAVARPLLPRAVPAAAWPAGRMVAAMLPRLQAGHRLYCVDGGNLFNPYPLTAAARSLALDPNALLERILVSRAYTCHQLVAAVEELLADAARRDPDAAGAILGIDRLFLDDDIAIEERRHLYGRILDEAARLSRAGMPLLITFVGGPGSPWVKFLSQRRRDMQRTQMEFFTPRRQERQEEAIESLKEQFGISE